MSSVDLIKSKIDIVSLISSYVKLEKAGVNYKGRCPFHNEKTPSFFVSQERGNYYCFGCHAKGDIFTFVEEFEGLDFKGALKVLADKAGVTLENFEPKEKSEKEKLYSVLELAVFFYEKKLSESIPAKEYLKSRGINEETIKKFRIGYAPNDWRELFDYLKSKGVSESHMLRVGLIKQKDGGGSLSSYYDVFRGRIVFPISDSSGRILGFSGRVLVSDPNSPKYLNTPETELFNKSQTLFGLDLAKKDIKLKDYSILVEGQMDLCMMHQTGLTNTVASSGTALTKDHLEKLRRFSNRIIMSFDADNAGLNASERAAKIALSLGMDLKLAQIPSGKDPADLAKENPELLKECFRNSKSIVDFYIDSLLTKDLPPKDLAIEIKKKVLPFIALLPDRIDQSQWINTIKRKTFINEEALWEDLKKVNVEVSEEREKITSPPGSKKVDVIERRITGLIKWKKENKGNNEELLEIINKLELEKKVREILGDRLDELEKYFENQKEALLFETESYYNNKTNLENDIQEIIISLEEEKLKSELSKAMTNLTKAEQKRESSEVLKFLEECQRITQRINTIKTIRSAYEKK